MNKRAYELANAIEMRAETEAICGVCGLCNEALSKEETEKYQNAVLKKIRSSERTSTARREKTTGMGRGQRHVGRNIAAACAAVFLCSVIIFGGQVQAAIKQIGWSIGSALGLSEEVAPYVDVVNTSAVDAGYVITLEEAAAAEDKLVVAYTLRREDGEPMEDVWIPEARFYMNDQEVRDGVYGNAKFTDEQHTTVGISAFYDVTGIDMAKENRYRLLFHKIDSGTRGKWDFQFTADGTDLVADSMRIPLQREFAIGDKADIVLEELVLNRLEQKIAFHIDGPSNYVISNYDLQVTAEDEAGHTVQFDVRRIDGVTGNGYMLNNSYLEEGWIDEETESLTLTFTVAKMIEEKGQTRRGDVLLEEVFTVDVVEK